MAVNMTSVDGSHSGLSQLGICVLAMVHKRLEESNVYHMHDTYVEHPDSSTQILWLHDYYDCCHTLKSC